MLELIIALFLVGSFALPLAQFPMQAMQEEFRSAYRMQCQRIADLAFAEIKESLYKQEVSWKDISSPKDKKAKIFQKTVEISFEPLGKRDFRVTGRISSNVKTGKNGEEHRLASIWINVKPLAKKQKLFRVKKTTRESRNYVYRVHLSKSTEAVNSESVETTAIKDTGT